MATQYQNIIEAVKALGIARQEGDATTYRAQIIPATMLEHSRVVMVKSADGSETMALETYKGEELIATHRVLPDDTRMLDYICDNLVSMHHDRAILMEAVKAIGINPAEGRLNIPVGGYIFSYDCHINSKGVPVFSNYAVQSNVPVDGRFPLRKLGDFPSFTDEELSALRTVIPAEQSDKCNKITAIKKLLAHEKHTYSTKAEETPSGAFGILLNKINQMIAEEGARDIFVDDYKKSRRLETRDSETLLREFKITKESDFVEETADFTKDAAIELETVYMTENNEMISRKKILDKDSTDAEIREAADILIMDCCHSGKMTEAEAREFIESISELGNVENENPEIEDDQPAKALSFDKRTAEGRNNLLRAEIHSSITRSLRNIYYKWANTLIPGNLVAQGIDKPYIKSAMATMLVNAADKGYKTAVYLTDGQIAAAGLNIKPEENPIQVRYDSMEVRLSKNNKKSTLSLSDYYRLSEKSRSEYNLVPKTTIMSVYNIEQTDITPEAFRDIYEEFQKFPARDTVDDAAAERIMDAVKVDDSVRELPQLARVLTESLVYNSVGRQFIISSATAKNILDQLDKLDLEKQKDLCEAAVTTAATEANLIIKEQQPRKAYASVDISKELGITKGKSIE